MGDTVSVEVARVNVTERKMDFELISHEPLTSRRKAHKNVVKGGAGSRSKTNAKSGAKHDGKPRPKAKAKAKAKVQANDQPKSKSKPKANPKPKPKPKAPSDVSAAEKVDAPKRRRRK
jgi:ribonuclease R